MNAYEKMLAAGVPEEWLRKELRRRAAFHFQRCGRLEEAAECLAESGDHEEAASLYLRTGEYAAAARLYAKAKRYESAVACWELLLAEEKNRSAETRPTALLGISACLLLLKRDPQGARNRYAEARKIVEDETGRTPLDSGKCWEALGEYGVALGRHDLMCVGFETALVRYGERQKRERLRAALAYLESAIGNRLLAEDLQSRIVGWSAEARPETPIVVLRNEPKIVEREDALEEFGLRWVEPEESGFRGKLARPVSYVENNFEDRGTVIFDRTTGLTWQKSGSDDWLKYKRVEEYVRNLNREQFAGYSDWRNPTFPELASLLEPEKNEHGIYISSLFDPERWWCWSSDKWSTGGFGWSVDFRNGCMSWYDLGDGLCVRVCRS